MRLYLIAVTVVITGYLVALENGFDKQGELRHLTDAMAIVEDAVMTVDSGQVQVAELLLRDNAPHVPDSVGWVMSQAVEQLAAGEADEAWRSLVYLSWSTQSQIAIRQRQVIEEQRIATMVTAVLLVASTLMVTVARGALNRLADRLVYRVRRKRSAADPPRGSRVIEARLSEVEYLLSSPRLERILKELSDVPSDQITVECTVVEDRLRFRSLVSVGSVDEADAELDTSESPQLALSGGHLWRM